jgi:MinD superfamily P-loop ATPase
MKEIVVISGKGGTGKTSITAALGTLAEDSIVIADCDVDAANLHLLLRPEISQEFDFWGGKIPVINNSRCSNCGECELICRFNAIEYKAGKYCVDEIECEGCSLCSYICPEKAISMIKKKSGKYYISKSRFGSKFIFARLDAARNNSGKLVYEVKSAAKEVARKEGAKFILIDGPPGLGCPAISSLSGAGLVLIVTESTLSGMSDLERILELINSFNLQAVCIINKADLNKAVTEKISSLCSLNKIDVVDKINYDDTFSLALETGLTLMESSNNKLKNQLKTIWEEINRRIG